MLHYLKRKSIHGSSIIIIIIMMIIIFTFAVAGLLLG